MITGAEDAASMREECLTKHLLRLTVLRVPCVSSELQPRGASRNSKSGYRYWLLQAGILKAKSYTSIQWHRRNLRFITLSHVLNSSLCERKQLQNDTMELEFGVMKPTSILEVMREIAPLWDEARLKIDEVGVRGATSS